MAIDLKHATVAAGEDAGNGEIAKAQWNEAHTLTAGANVLLGTTTAGAVGEISCTAAGRALLDDADTAAQRATLSAATLTQTDFIAGIIEAPADQDYRLIVNAPYAMTIASTTTRSLSGTCTATFKINTTALGGTANSVSSTESEQSHGSANAVAAGDDIVVTVSSNSSCVDLSFTIKFTRTLS